MLRHQEKMIAHCKANNDPEGKLDTYLSKFNLLKNSLERIAVTAKTTSVNIMTSLEATRDEVIGDLVALTKEKLNGVDFKLNPRHQHMLISVSFT